MSELKKNNIVYYTRILPSSNIYDLLELKIRTIEKDWFVGIEKRDKQAFLFQDTELNKTVFMDRKIALEKVKEAETNKKEIKDEDIYYEE